MATNKDFIVKNSIQTGSPIAAAYGGTGVNNGSNTLTLSGGSVTLTTSGATNVTLPTSGTLLTSSNISTVTNQIAYGGSGSTLTSSSDFTWQSGASQLLTLGTASVGPTIEASNASGVSGPTFLIRGSTSNQDGGDLSLAGGNAGTGFVPGNVLISPGTGGNTGTTAVLLSNASGSVRVNTNGVIINGEMAININGAIGFGSSLTSISSATFPSASGQVMISGAGGTGQPSWTGSPSLTGLTLSGSLTLSGNTANSFVYSDSSKHVVTTAAPTNGQLLIGSTGAAPVAATLTAGSGITITNSAGGITIASSGGGGSSLTQNTIGYGDASNLLTGTTDFTWNDGSQTLSFGSATTGPTLQANTGSSVGTTFTIYGSTGTGSANGGALNITGGTAGASGGVGGLVTISGGTSKGSNIGGTVTIQGGAPTNGQGECCFLPKAGAKPAFSRSIVRRPVIPRAAITFLQ